MHHEPSVKVRLAVGEGLYLTGCNQVDAKAKHCKGVIDEIITDVLKVKEMVAKGELHFAVINVNDCKMKFKFDNVYSCRSGARVFVTECDHICALQVSMEGIKNDAMDENIGHFDEEIGRADLEDLEGMNIDNIMPQVDCSVFPDCELLFPVINVNDCVTKFKFSVYGCRSGARVFVTECDHICALKACMEGIQNNTIDESIGHPDNEIDGVDLEGLEGMKIGDIMPQINCFVFPKGPDAVVLNSERFLTDTLYLLKV